jgi:uncharacterized protein YraI
VQFKLIYLLLTISVIGAGCTADGSSVAAPSLPTPDFVTATLPPTSIPLPTQTSLPPTAIPTIQPIEGTTNTQINVRAETSTASESLGILPAFTKVQVTGKDASGIWLRIVYAEAPAGFGWVRAEFVPVDASAEIPVVGVETGSGAERSGVVLSGINVRSGPGIQFELLGVLVQNDVVSVLGKDESGAWLQIEFAESPDGKGWAAVEFLQVDEAESLPVVGAETVEEQQVAVTAQTAVLDGDSEGTPLAEFILAPSAIRAFQVSGEVSAPNGDTDDWVTFSAKGVAVTIELICSTQFLQVELWNNGIRSDTPPVCGEVMTLKLPAESFQQIRLFAEGSSEQVYARYILKVSVIQ